MVLESFATGWTSRHILACVVNGHNGRTIDALTEHNIPRKYLTDSGNQTAAIKSAVEAIGGCDYLISIGWPHKVPSGALEIPEVASLNVHSSYLPNYRGLSVFRVQWAHAEATAGVTVHHMTETYDAGKIVTQQPYSVSLLESPLSMVESVGALSSVLVREAILLTDAGYRGCPQERVEEYYGKIPWRTVLIHGIVNHLARLFSIDYRWRIPPNRSV